ncbi:hypothetical protein RUND412_009296 [Rhizina undulata]
MDNNFQNQTWQQQEQQQPPQARENGVQAPKPKKKKKAPAAVPGGVPLNQAAAEAGKLTKSEKRRLRKVAEEGTQQGVAPSVWKGNQRPAAVEHNGGGYDDRGFVGLGNGFQGVSQTAMRELNSGYGNGNGQVPPQDPSYKGNGFDTAGQKYTSSQSQKPQPHPRRQSAKKPREKQSTYSLPDPSKTWEEALPTAEYVAPPLPEEEDEDFTQQMELLSQAARSTSIGIQRHELKNAPIFSANAKALAEHEEGHVNSAPIFPQYGLFAASLGLVEGTEIAALNGVGNKRVDPRVFLNSNAPFSTFICGLQGSGKSHTLACMLENFIFRSPALGRLPNPLAGLVFHFDKYTSLLSTVRPCEAAYLASDVPIRVLVSASNLDRMKKLYSQITAAHPPVVEPLKLRQADLNIERMLSLMAVDQEGKAPLYMETVRKILRDLAGSGGGVGLDYFQFKSMLDNSELSPSQRSMLSLRLDVLESFMDLGNSRGGRSNLYETLPGTMTIVDLSDPFVDEGSACALFDICLGLFLENGVKNGIVIALDEAHKYMAKAASAEKFTDTLLSIIRQQRHLNARVLISTQEPTISPRLLDLCNMTIVHRFTSPEWLLFVRQHIAAAAKESMSKKINADNLMKMIVGLSEGEAYVFATTGLVTSNEFAVGNGNKEIVKGDGSEADVGREEGPRLMKLGLRVLKLKVRKRITRDGGKSLLADGIWG